MAEPDTMPDRLDAAQARLNRAFRWVTLAQLAVSVTLGVVVLSGWPVVFGIPVLGFVLWAWGQFVGAVRQTHRALAAERAARPTHLKGATDG